MSITAVALVPTPPLLVPELAGGAAGRDAELRRACDDAVVTCLDGTPEHVLVVGAGPVAAEVTGSWDWRGFGISSPPVPPAQALPLALAVGAWLLDRHGWGGGRRFLSVPPDLPSQACARLGAALDGGETSIAVLVCGDGSARRSDKAPGHLHAGARPWDDRVAAALGGADCAALAALTPDEGAELMATGRAVWQVVAAAAAHRRWRSRLRFSAAPYGVAYHVATWH